MTRVGDTPPSHIPLFDSDGAMSREYLLWRGHCCDNGCRNCPYRDPRESGRRP